MGRQIAIAATRADEKAFLEFVNSTALVRIAETFAPTTVELWVEDFAEETCGHFFYDIWNTAFDWDPTYAQSREGSWYISNKGTAPIVEFSRTCWDRPEFGRLYWAKFFSAPNGLEYDVEAFSRWYDLLVRWIRKHGKRRKSVSHEPYFLPDAWERWHRMRTTS